jgi:nucleotide-binding universal stress UspA family protein
MTTPTGKKLLVALDCSQRSIDTVKDVAQMPSLCRMQIHLFHVFAGIPEIHWDFNQEAAVGDTASLDAWESQQRANIETHLEKCREILLARDISPENIHIQIKRRKRGVALDILDEAANGYAAVVMRKRGLSKLDGLVMGGTTQRLLDSACNIPLIFAGRKPGNPRVLIGFDGSDNSYRAVDFACTMLDSESHSVTLVTVLRTYPGDDHQVSGKSAFKGLMQLPLDPVNRHLSRASKRLHAAGFSADRVKTHIEMEAVSRAGTLLDLAAKEDLGTIIVGRRGHSILEDFNLGRVSSKIIQLGTEQAVWVVN